jgi:tyrosinase
MKYLGNGVVLKRSKPRSTKFKTNNKSRTLNPLLTNYTGSLNVYSRMVLRLSPRIETIAAELETLPRVNQSDFEEKQQFINAFKTIIKNGQFADLISIHSNAYKYRIHTEDTDVDTNERFLPWHRVFLYELELRLNSTPEANSRIRIPYWDWTVDRKVPDWLADFKPTIENVLVFPESSADRPIPVSTTIQVERTPGKQISPTTGRPYELPTQSQVHTLNSKANFKDFTAYLEGIHGLPHLWVGGTMAHYISPADPLFWLHHSNIDRLWDLWPSSQSKLPNLQGDNAVMTPWSYRTDSDPIQDTKFFQYNYK